MRVHGQAAFVLHHRAYGETSMLVELFTREHGRIGAIAKGARRPRARHGNILISFQPLIVDWSGKGELVVITEAEARGQNIALQGKALFCGFYINELMLRLLHRYDPHQSLFDIYGQALYGLLDEHTEAVLRVFEKRLLIELGYGLVLDHEIRGNSPIQPGADYLYIPDAGPVPYENDEDGAVKIKGQSLLALSRETLNDDAVLQESKMLMRAILGRHLGDKPLHSRKLFREVKYNSSTPRY